MKKVVWSLLVAFTLVACKKEEKVAAPVAVEELPVEEPVKVIEFGFDLDEYIVKRDTIRYGDSFGEILERNNIGYPKIFQIAENAKDTFDIRKLQVGKPYTLLCAKGDSLQAAQCFIYQPNRVEYVVIDFQDSIKTYIDRKPIRIEEKTASGVIKGSLYQTMVDQGLSPILAYDMSDIYAWTIDFFRIQEGDKFKVIYTEKFINDSISVGIDDIKACYFEHVGEPIYAFRFQTDSIKGIVDYFDENAKNLRRAFLKAPVQFSRISSRYNLKRRIRYYGNRIRPHRGTDFAAPVGSQILATASGTVIKSERRGGNGNYVKIKHNNTYSTQYLHMKKRKVKVGDFVKQGDIIGWVGMTGNTSGPHVCYRFWKHGREVDPFKQKLPDADPISDELKAQYLDFIENVKIQLDAIPYPIEKQLQDTEQLIIDTTEEDAVTKP